MFYSSTFIGFTTLCEDLQGWQVFLLIGIGILFIHLQARQSTVHEHVGGKMMQFHSLDISGPILPEPLHNLSCLFQQTQHSNFTVYTTSVVSTGSFNAASMKPSTLPPPSSSPTSKFNHYLTLKPISQKSGLKEVSCKNDCYTWN